MNWLSILPYFPTLLRIIPTMQSIWNTSTTGSSTKIGQSVQALAPALAPVLEGIGSAMFPLLAPAFHIAAGAVAAFHPDAVMWMQQMLNDNGATPPLAVDGHFGPKTTAAVKAFQAANGLAVTGWLDDAETALLQRLLPA